MDAYNQINSVYQQQAQLQTQITMQQNEIIADAAEEIWNAYQRGYALEQESILRQAEMNVDMFDSPEDIERSIDVVEATVGFSVAVYEVAKITVVANPSTAAVVLAIGGVIWGGRAICRALQ